MAKAYLRETGLIARLGFRAMTHRRLAALAPSPLPLLLAPSAHALIVPQDNIAGREGRHDGGEGARGAGRPGADDHHPRRDHDVHVQEEGHQGPLPPEPREHALGHVRGHRVPAPPPADRRGRRPRGHAADGQAEGRRAPGAGATTRATRSASSARATRARSARRSCSPAGTRSRASCSTSRSSIERARGRAAAPARAPAGAHPRRRRRLRPVRGRGVRARARRARHGADRDRRRDPGRDGRASSSPAPGSPPATGCRWSTAPG